MLAALLVSVAAHGSAACGRGQDASVDTSVEDTIGDVATEHTPDALGDDTFSSDSSPMDLGEASDSEREVQAETGSDTPSGDLVADDAAGGDGEEADAAATPNDAGTDIADGEVTASTGFSGVASFTWYVSYAACCPDNENYDPDADTTECDLYSACDYPGTFAGFDRQVPLDWVQSHTLVAFFDARHPTIEEWRERYANKVVRLTRGDVTVDALIADTCGDWDCDGCCSANAEPSGVLVDMEYWSVLANFADISAADGQIHFEILEDCGGLALDDCGVCGGDNATCTSVADGCAQCAEEGASCYVDGWTEPCMNSTRQFCLEEVEDYDSFWCPDHV